MIQFDVSALDRIRITAAARRAVALAKKRGGEYALKDADMDITACHRNGMPLDLVKLLQADDFAFAHDVFSIRRHINRRTGRIENRFVPRCAAAEEEAA